MKMKKILLYVLALILIIPLQIKADTYQKAIYEANNFITEFSNYNQYILIGNELPYNYENGVNKVDENFKNGGFASKDEYLITNINNTSYLSSGIEYWTLTKADSVKNHTIRMVLSQKNITTDESNVRVTEFVQNDVEIVGAGTRSNPWVFKEIFSVTLRVTNENRGLLSTKECSQGDKYSQITVKKTDGSNTVIYICPTEHFEYNPEKSTCRPYLTYKENSKYELGDAAEEKLVNNMICTVDFAYQTTQVSFVSEGENSGTNPVPVYLANNKTNWFSDPKGYTTISSIRIPEKTGYIFGGYYTEANGAGTQIINSDGIFNTTSFNGTKLYPKWTPITFYVSFNTNGGNNSVSTIQCTYDQDCILPQATGVLTRNNHTFWGWNKTAKSPAGGNPTVDFKDKANAKNQVTTDRATLELYAMWRIDYYCTGGATLVEDSSKGWICKYNSTATTESYKYSCESCGTCFRNDAVECGSPYSWPCGEGKTCWAGSQTCYVSIPYSCCSSSTCTGTRTVYTCGSGNVYSGSGSGTICYTPALSS